LGFNISFFLGGGGQVPLTDSKVYQTVRSGKDQNYVTVKCFLPAIIKFCSKFS